ncbi:hypothetical protein ACF3NA_01930 [Alkanindiges sp. WGS2144]|uniref:hypothetical protein n=1 Tax=Alkanindiges sp. WGS2144 TaxID=3366808 RepID=UPI003752258F
MSPFLSLHSLIEYKQSQQFQGLLLILRFLLAAILGWQVYTVANFSAVYINQNIYTALIGYSLLSALNYLLVLFKPTRPAIFYSGLVIDLIFALSLPFMLINQASIAVIIAIIFTIAALHDLKLALLNTILVGFAIAALTAGWLFNTLAGSQLQTPHLVAAATCILGYLYYFRTSSLYSTIDVKPALSPALGQKRQLIEGLSYLYPYHQRNQIPLSLLMVRIESAPQRQKAFARQLFNAYKGRLRKCDLLVQINKQHLAVLLCDTNASQTGQLVKALMQIKEGLGCPAIHLTYGVCSIPLEQEISLEKILVQMMDALNEAEHQKVQRLIFVTARQSD